MPRAVVDLQDDPERAMGSQAQRNSETKEQKPGLATQAQVNGRYSGAHTALKRSSSRAAWRRKLLRLELSTSRALNQKLEKHGVGVAVASSQRPSEQKQKLWTRELS